MDHSVFSKQQMADISKNGGNAAVLAAVFEREIRKTKKALKSANHRFFRKMNGKKNEKKIDVIFRKFFAFLRINIKGRVDKEESSLARNKAWCYLEKLMTGKEDFLADPRAYLFCVVCGDKIFKLLKTSPIVRKCVRCGKTNNGNGQRK